jgi:hypothetical protein
LDRATDYESVGQKFESSRAHFNDRFPVASHGRILPLAGISVDEIMVYTTKKVVTNAKTMVSPLEN